MGYNKELQGQIKTYEHQLEALSEETQMVANENEQKTKEIDHLKEQEKAHQKEI